MHVLLSMGVAYIGYEDSRGRIGRGAGLGVGSNQSRSLSVLYSHVLLEDQRKWEGRRRLKTAFDVLQIEEQFTE